jgi:hypothetical protein
MPVIFCKECEESIYLNPHAYWTISDTRVECDKCKTINTMQNRTIWSISNHKDLFMHRYITLLDEGVNNGYN